VKVLEVSFLNHCKLRNLKENYRRKIVSAFMDLDVTI